MRLGSFILFTLLASLSRAAEPAFPVPLNTNATTDSRPESNVTVATDGAGNMIAVWVSWDSLGGTVGTDGDILFARSEDDGVSWSYPAPIHAFAVDDTGDEHWPWIATDRQGLWVVVFRSPYSFGGTLGSDDDILSVRSTDNGLTWSEPISPDSDAPGSTRTDVWPQLASSGSAFVTAWASLSSRQQVRVARSADGISWSPRVVLGERTAYHELYPSVAASPAGVWVVGWTFIDGADRDIFFSRSTDDGVSWSLAAALNSNASGDVGADDHVQVATDGAGKWLACWDSSNVLPAGTSAADLDIHCSISLNDGETWDAPFLVSSDMAGDSIRSEYPHIAFDGGSEWIATWQSDGASGLPTGTDTDLWYSLSLDLSNWSAVSALNVNSDSDVGGDIIPFVLARRPRDWFAAWHTTDSLGGTIGTDWDILQTSFISGPTPSPTVSPSPTPSPTGDTPSPSPSPTPSPTPTDSPTPSPTPTPVAGLPRAPEGLRATGGANSILLEWFPNTETDLIGYNLYRALSPETTFTQRINATPIADTRYVDDGVDLNVDYYYRATALNPVGESRQSETAYARAGGVVAILRDGRGPAGGTATVVLAIENARGISGGGLQFDVGYDPAILSALRVEGTGMTAGFVIEQQNLTQPGVVRFIATAPTFAPLQGQGGLFRIVFGVAEGLAEGTRTTVSFLDAIVFDDEVRRIPVDMTDTAQVTVDSRHGLGDINGDRSVNVGDVLLAQLVAVGDRTVSDEAFAAGDVNGDGRIDAADATLIGRIAVGLPLDGSPGGAGAAGIASRAAAPVSFHIDAAGVACSGEEIVVPLVAEGLAGVAGMDFVVSFDPTILAPEGTVAGPAASDFVLRSTTGESEIRIVLSAPVATDSAGGVVAEIRFRVVDPDATLIPVGLPLARANGELGDNFAWNRSVTASGAIVSRGSLACGASPTILYNLSTRGFVGEGADVMIAGLIVTGTEARRVLVSGIGPDLANFGVTGVLSNPSLTILQGAASLAENDDWGLAGNADAILATGLAPSNERESALLITLPPGEYTAILSGVGDTTEARTGVGLVQAFDLTDPEADTGSARLGNVSTRLGVGTGDRVMIGGFTVRGATSRRVLVRGLGPTLGAAPFVVPGAMADPELILFGPGDSGPVRIGANTDWTASSESDRLAIEATGKAPPDPREPAILAILPPGAYTAVISGANGSQGVALVEVYEAPE